MRNIFCCMLFCYVITGCDDKQSVVHYVSDFNRPIFESIVPKIGKSYTTKYIKIKGHCNDSVRVSFGNDYYFYFKGNNIDELINTDFYGEGDVKFIFDPYKAKSGDLMLEFAIL